MIFLTPIITPIVILLFIILVILINIKTYNVEGFVTDAHWNQIYMIDDFYKSFSNFYDPLKLLYEKLIFRTSNANDTIHENNTPTYQTGDSTYTTYNPNNTTCIKLTDDQKKLISIKQPKFFNKLNLVNGRYYYDERFPEEPVPVEFALNAEKFCKNNIGVYPCYRYKQRWNF